MRYRVVILGLVIVLAMATIASAAVTSTVAVIPQGIEGRPGAWPAMDRICTDILAKSGYAVVHGAVVQQALDKLGVKVTNGEKGSPVPVVVQDKNFLQELAQTLGVGAAIGVTFENHSSWPFFKGTKGQSVCQAVMVTKDGEVISPPANEQRSSQKDLSAATRVAVAGTGVAMASGRAFTHWGSARWVGWAVIPVSFITFKSRCDREIEAMGAAAKKALGDLTRAN